MKVAIRPRSARTRTQRFVRWSSRVVFLFGVAALTYVAFTVVHARFFQIAAMRSLQSQIQLQTRNDHKISRVQLAVKEGDVLGRIDIPRLGVSLAVLQGTSPRILRLGAGHIEGTPLPWEAGNSGIAGHRDTFFRGLKDIQPNDEIQLQTVSGFLRYEVEWVKVVAPDDMSVLDPSIHSALTLVTCYPFYLVGSAPKRFVVHARRK